MKNGAARMTRPRKHVPGAGRRARYGGFSADGLSYVVTSTETPRPWCNLLGNKEFGGLFSQCGQGFLWYLSHNHEQVTNWQEFHYGPFRMARGRLVFVKDRRTGRYWAANPQPGETGFRGFSCRVEPGVSTIRAARHGVDFTMQAFVPWDADIEIWTLTFRNAAGRNLDLAIVPVVEFPTRRIVNICDAEFIPALRAIHAVDSDRRQPAGAFFACDAPVSAHDARWDAFYGPLNDRLHPRAMETGLTNSAGQDEYCVGALEIRLALRPGESRSFRVFTGRAADRRSVRLLLARFRRPGAVDAALADVRARFADQRSRFQARLPDRGMQTALNCWSPYCVSIAARFRQQVKIGYRDLLQYERGHLVFDHAQARANILKILQYQYACGRAIRAYRPYDGSADLRDARDGVSWIADTLASYIKETGDAAILDAVVPYFDKGSGTVWEHAVRAVRFLYAHRGRHRMCLVGGGDWNDALELGGKRGRGESVWLTVAACRALRHTADIAVRFGRAREAGMFRRWRRELVRDINGRAWDGDWYVYGFTDDGRPVGSRSDAGGRIYANVQSWALLEGIVPAGRVARLWRSVEDYLYTDVGALVLHPPYAAYRPEIGRISAMATGTYEHASAYAHGTAFLVAAYAANRMGRKAVECWHRVHPSNPLNPHSGCEPYGCTTFYTGPSSRHFGRSLNSWFTGSASWIYFVAAEMILGVRPDFDGLRVDPAVPRTWRRYEVVRRFRGGTYRIRVRNPDGVEHGVRCLLVNGKAVAGNLIPVCGPGSHEVDVLMGG